MSVVGCMYECLNNNKNGNGFSIFNDDNNENNSNVLGGDIVKDNFFDDDDSNNSKEKINISDIVNENNKDLLICDLREQNKSLLKRVEELEKYVGKNVNDELKKKCDFLEKAYERACERNQNALSEKENIVWFKKENQQQELEITSLKDKIEEIEKKNNDLEKQVNELKKTNQERDKDAKCYNKHWLDAIEKCNNLNNNLNNLNNDPYIQGVKIAKEQQAVNDGLQQFYKKKFDEESTPIDRFYANEYERYKKKEPLLHNYYKNELSKRKKSQLLFYNKEYKKYKKIADKHARMLDPIKEIADKDKRNIKNANNIKNSIGITTSGQRKVL